MNCKNCHTEHTANFCPNCGQKTIDKHTFRSVFSGIMEVVELERGFFKTLWDILIRPSAFFEGYLSGKTKPYTNPIVFFIVLASFSTVLINLFIKADKSMEQYHIISMVIISDIILIAIGYTLSLSKKLRFTEYLIVMIYVVALTNVINYIIGIEGAHKGYLPDNIMFLINLIEKLYPPFILSIIFWKNNHIALRIFKIFLFVSASFYLQNAVNISYLFDSIS
ncbi:DUF3667 domain-containing protein [Candidatus Kapabacteria bacterium]|nr:DUF3667 domain-containing protein [Candidatus Kapabacteria bacterium]